MNVVFRKSSGGLRVVFSVVFVLTVFAVPAYTHEWYDYDCCDTRDCYPLPEDAFLDELPDGNYFARWISPRDGKLIEGVVAARNVRDSQNRQLHGCQTNYGTPRCLYIYRGT